MLKVIKVDGGIMIESDSDMIPFKEIEAIVPEILEHAKEEVELSLLLSMPDKIKDIIGYLKTKELISRFFAFFFAGVAIYCILKLYGVL